MIRCTLLAAAMTTLVANSTFAGKFNKVLSTGDAAPVFTNLENVDGRRLSLADFKGRDILVVAITCNHCPVAQDYEDRIIAFGNKNSGTSTGKVGFVAINVNTIPDDNLPAMKLRAKKKSYRFPYLFDPSQKIARALGARVTPEFFVFDKDRKLVYTGAMDDSLDDKQVKIKYLELTVSAALEGKRPEVAESEPNGCDIKYNK